MSFEVILPVKECTLNFLGLISNMFCFLLIVYAEEKIKTTIGEFLAFIRVCPKNEGQEVYLIHCP
jgi:hypothetical protein